MLLVVLLVHYTLGLTATLNKCATFDEPLHIAGGYSYLMFNDYRMHPENGLLPQCWVSALAALSSLQVSTETEAWMVGDKIQWSLQLFYNEGNDPDRLLLWGRIFNGWWSVATGLLVFLWSRRNLGAAAAWMSLTLWAFSPLFLAHGFVATSDACAAFFFLASVLSFWTLLHRGDTLRFLACATSLLGLFLSKFSAPLVLPMLVVMILMRLVSAKAWFVTYPVRTVIQKRRWRFIGSLCVLGLLGVTTWIGIWTAYRFRYSAIDPDGAAMVWTPSWDELLQTRSHVVELVAFARNHRLLPEAYLYGFAFVLQHSQQRIAFLLGETSLTGWVQFFPFCELAKTPSGQFLIAAAAGFGVLNRWRGAEGGRMRWIARGIYRTTPLWALFIVYWIFALTTHLNIGHRHLLPIQACVFCFLGTAVWCVPKLRATSNDKRNRELSPKRAIVIGRYLSLSWLIFSVLSVGAGSLNAWPNYIAFFNQVVGGPGNGWRMLVDSSLDWGQDLPSLRDWIDENALNQEEKLPIYLCYFGMGDPAYYQLDVQLLPTYIDLRDPAVPVGLKPGIYCFSASMLQGVYTSAPGPWTNQLTQMYQHSRNKYIEFIAASGSMAIDDYWVSLPEADKQQWGPLLYTYEELRLVKLTHLLRHREPDDNVQHSILIFRVSQSDIDWIESPMPFP